MFEYYPYLFDSKPAWERTISDSRFSYDMNFMSFMNIYAEYRKNDNEGKKYQVQFTPTFILPTLEPKITKVHETNSPTALLTQSEIDELLNSFLT